MGLVGAGDGYYSVFRGELEIATWASDMKRATAVRHYTIRRADDPGAGQVPEDFGPHISLV